MKSVKSIDVIEKEFNDANKGIKYKDVKADDKTLYNQDNRNTHLE